MVTFKFIAKLVSMLNGAVYFFQGKKGCHGKSKYFSLYSYIGLSESTVKIEI